MRPGTIAARWTLLGLAGAVSACSALLNIGDLPGLSDSGVPDGASGGGGGGGGGGHAGGGGSGGAAAGGGGGSATGGGGGQAVDGGFDAGCGPNEAFCNGGCTDVSGDNANCGGCGLVCGANDCDAGRCLVLLATSPGTVGQNIAIDSTNVYWNYYVSTTSSVGSVPVGGGSVTPVASTSDNLWGMVSSGSALYWTATNNGQDGGSIVSSRVPPFTPSPFTIATGFEPPSTPGPIALQGLDVYFSDINGGGQDFVSKVNGQSSGNPVIKVAAPGTEMFGLATDSQYVYWTEFGTGRVSRVGLDGGTPEPIATAQNLPFGLAVDSVNAYWVTLSGTVASVSIIDGGPPNTLASGQKPSGYLAIDSSNVYFTNSGCAVDGGPCPSILKVPVGGGPVTTLLYDQGFPQGIAVDANSVYWVNVDKKQIMKLTPK